MYRPFKVDPCDVRVITVIDTVVDQTLHCGDKEVMGHRRERGEKGSNAVTVIITGKLFDSFQRVISEIESGSAVRVNVDEARHYFLPKQSILSHASPPSSRSRSETF